MKKFLISIIVLLILAVIGGGVYYWFFFILNPNKSIVPIISKTFPEIFSPFNNTKKEPEPEVVTQKEPPVVATTTVTIDNIQVFKQPKLRQISKTPVAGVFASSTASSSIVRYMDRGTGHLFEANNLSNEVKTLSNTTLPKIYEAYGNRNGNNFIIRYLKDDSDIISNFYTELRSTGTSTSQTPFELKGKFLSGEVDQIAISPTGDRVFTWNIESGDGVGYISNFDEKIKTKVYSSPLTQVNIDWPATTTLTLSTKASSVASGFIYSIDTKTGDLRTLIGNIKGLAGKMSRDATKILLSSRTNGSIATSVRNLKDNTSIDILFKTLTEKCVWSGLRVNELYCAVPTQIPQGEYPDDWYMGKISFIDQIWHVDTKTGEVNRIANLLELSEVLIDATNLTLDPKENILYFINKNDLTLWALDLKQD
jgi:hypothetical protein